jgi:Ankyrin repeats (3 copies)
MASVLVLRIPYWRTFVIYIPDWHQIFHDVTSLIRRKARPQIFEEIESGNDQAAIQLATPKGLVKWRGEWGESPLVVAIQNGRSELACSFMQMAGTAPNDGALAAAAMRGDLRVVNALLAIGKNPDEPIHDSDFQKGWTPLMWATNRHHIQVMEVLLAVGANVDVVAEDGTTAAMCTLAGKPEDIEALEVLCRYKPNITIKDWRGRNLIREALDRERCSGMPEMRLLLERYYPKTLFDTVNY